MKQAMTFFFFGDVIAVTNFSGKNLVPPQNGLSSYAHAFKDILNIYLLVVSHWSISITNQKNCNPSVH